VSLSLSEWLTTIITGYIIIIIFLPDWASVGKVAAAARVSQTDKVGIGGIVNKCNLPFQNQALGSQSSLANRLVLMRLSSNVH